MIIRDEYLIKINVKNKIQYIRLQLDYNDITKIYSIYRTSAQYKGKEHEKGNVYIEYGKGTLSPAEYAAQLFNNFIRHYLLKKYILLSKSSSKTFNSLDEEQLRKIIANTPRDADIVPKPMMSKSYDKCYSSIFEKEMYVMPLLNGVRCLFYYKNNSIHTKSLWGESYDLSLNHLIKDPSLERIFAKYPDLILDGEIYINNIIYDKNKLIKLCNTKSCIPELEYWIYDIISDKNIQERSEFLLDLEEELNSDKFKIVKYIPASGYLKLKRIHNSFIQQGFEGLKAYLIDKKYMPNTCSSHYAIYYSDALRQSFTLKRIITEGDEVLFVVNLTKNKELKIPVAGDLKAKQFYINNQDSYIGKKITCIMTDTDGIIPINPIVRYLK